MFHQHHIGVVIPAFNEERLIGSTLRSLPSFVDEVIVVDDGSRDRTRVRVREFAATCDVAVSLECHEHNRGVGAAIVTGYKKALEHACDVAVVMGADAQMDPVDLPGLLMPVVLHDADYVKGNRFAWPGAQDVVPPLRYWGGWALSLATRMISGYPDLVDSQCGYTAIRCDTLRKLPLDALYPRYGYPNDMLAWLGIVGARVRQRTVRPVYAGERSDLSVRRVALPIGGLLLRAGLRRLQYKMSARLGRFLKVPG